VSGRSHDRQRATSVTATGQLHGRLRAVSRVRCHVHHRPAPRESHGQTALSQETVNMDSRARLSGYFWPAITAVLVSVPLYLFRGEESVLHTIFRVAWLLVLVLGLVEIGRNLYRDLRGRRVPAGPSGTRPPDGL
jgi:hypothetical protein